MPPKPKIIKEMILNTVMDITREAGFKAVNARSIAKNLQCSTRPIFTCYETMEALKSEFFQFAYEYYEDYVSRYPSSANVNPVLLLPLSYIEFAQRETHLFQLLFIDDMDLNMTEANDFFKEIGNEKKAQQFGGLIGVEPQKAKMLFLDLFLYTHGIAVLAATKKFTLSRERAEIMVANFLTSVVRRENPDWALSNSY